MKGDDLLSKLQSLKDQLSFIGDNYENQIGTLEKRKHVDERLDIKLKQLESLNEVSNKIVIDACGKIFETSKQAVGNCMYESILTKELGKEGEVYVHLDIPRNYFKHLLAMVRFFDKNEIERDLFQVELEEKVDNIANFKRSVVEFFTDKDLLDKVKINKVKPKRKL